MGGKNFLLRKIDEAYNRGLDEGFSAGMRVGIQLNNDIYQTILHDSDIMGKDTFGVNRLLKIHNAAEERVKEYSPALRAYEAESDVAREHLDAKLKKAVGELFQPFEERYPELTKCEYGGKRK